MSKPETTPLDAGFDPVTAPLVDTHCHLAFEAFDEDRAEVIERARAAGLVGCVAVAVDAASAGRARELADAWPGWAHATVGIHPTEDLVGQADELARVRELAASGQFVAVGETGLDAFHDCAPMEVQIASLREHLALALDLDLPVVLHCRDAFSPLAEVLAAHAGAPLRGVLHCYTGGEAELGPLLAAGLHIGVGGIATYKPRDDLRAAVRAVPDDRLLVETDAPWLSPLPRRGRRNEPAFVAHTAARLADDRGMSRAEFARITTANARRLFRLPS